MGIDRGIVLTIVFTIVSAIGGGLSAVFLNWMAPSYYPAVFPVAAMRGDAHEVAVVVGVAQGLILGVITSGIVAIGLWWLGQLSWKACARALINLCLCGIVFGVGGVLIGWAIGEWLPDYYRTVIRGGDKPGFSPRDVGIGLGGSQGIILGVIVGGLGTLAGAWQRSARDASTSQNVSINS